MAEGQLESVMLKFAGGAADVLVCTTIIESGLDIPNANTIVIDRADTLGLAQLYQLRGRVGRSSRRAYAYLLYRRRERMSEEARKRLQAIFNASELGAGFQIALSDLEIRGAGNILGGEQSGHMAAVGFDLYSRLLAEAVEQRKASRENRAPVLVPQQAVVDLPLEAHLPDDYVADEAQKLELYRRLANARTAGDVAAFRQEVIDRFGPMPLPVQRLAEVAELRLAAETIGIASMSREEGQLVVRFGAGLSRATAMRLLTPGSLPGVRHSDVTFASNQVRIRLPKDPLKGWQLTQAIVARLSAELAPIGAEHIAAMRPERPEPTSRSNPYGPTARPGFDEPI
jgi:transcription-repair coupling factor (superfamily II helicase)